MALDMNTGREAVEMAIAGMETIGIATQSATAMAQALFMWFMKKGEEPDGEKSIKDLVKEGEEEQARIDKICAKLNITSPKVGILTRDVDPAYNNVLKNLCNRDGITMVNLGALDLNDGTENKDMVMILSTQETHFKELEVEAMIRSGYLMEVPMSDLTHNTPKYDRFGNECPDFEREKPIVNDFLKEPDKNPVKIYKDMSMERYVQLKSDIQKLNPDMRFTLMPEFKDNGKVDVGFLSFTEPKVTKDNFKQQYDIEKIVRALTDKELLVDYNPKRQELIEKNAEFDKFKLNKINTAVAEIDANSNSINFMTKNELRQNIASLDIPAQDRVELLQCLERYPLDINAKSDFVKALNKAEIEPELKAQIQKGIDGLGKEKYIVPITITEDRDGHFEYMAKTDKIMSLDKNLTVMEKGQDDLVIGNGIKAKTFLDKEFMQLENSGDERERNMYIVVSKDELDKLQKNKVFEKDEVEYLNNFDENQFLMHYTAEQAVERGKASPAQKEQYLIDQINKKANMFMAESEQDGRTMEHVYNDVPQNYYLDTLVDKVNVEQGLAQEGYTDNIPAEIVNDVDEDRYVDEKIDVEYKGMTLDEMIDEAKEEVEEERGEEKIPEKESVSRDDDNGLPFFGDD